MKNANPFMNSSLPFITSLSALTLGLGERRVISLEGYNKTNSDYAVITHLLILFVKKCSDRGEL